MMTNCTMLTWVKGEHTQRAKKIRQRRRRTQQPPLARLGGRGGRGGRQGGRGGGGGGRRRGGGGAAGGEVGRLVESGRGMRVMMLEVGKMVVEQMGDSLPRIGM